MSSGSASEHSSLRVVLIRPEWLEGLVGGPEGGEGLMEGPQAWTGSCAALPAILRTPCSHLQLRASNSTANLSKQQNTNASCQPSHNQFLLLLEVLLGLVS